MTLSSVFYISRSTVAAADTEAVVREIVAVAVRNNPPLSLTGAMMFTGTHFAQMIEGEAATIDTLMARIRHDPRHDDLLVVAYDTVERRRFPDWSMAYFGPSQLVSRHVTRLLNDPSPAERRRTTDWLADLLSGFGREQPRQP